MEKGNYQFPAFCVRAWSCVGCFSVKKTSIKLRSREVRVPERLSPLHQLLESGIASTDKADLEVEFLTSMASKWWVQNSNLNLLFNEEFNPCTNNYF